MYICPLCQSPLIADRQGYECHQRHRFDRAKEGYVNLLPVQHKGSKDPGDSPQMLQARRQFLDEGHYQPLRDKVSQLLEQYLPTDSLSTIVDLGCGEGYYTSALVHQQRQVYGVDVAKYAVKAAAKRYPDIHFSVASGYRLPFASGSLSAIVRIYAPSKAEELARTLCSGGILLTVTPAARHLCQFKALIYDDVQLHDEKDEALNDFECLLDTTLHYPLTLSASSATQLLQMTPFAWRANQTVWQTLENSDSFYCETDFRIRVWRKL
ncbi:23S rRNA (guanine(745)-N(1))-methyltransferase [Rosenbergiella australiborealis]|uniref:23S rRNA (Guanine(745)-N(1))-methyltransferase n=2 Tax=Rosenbergiella australiborealis TaxID=1544696 RepID=A0ABS5T1R5_9GAMM|nr:23S rRNA (guanine(745)-N(1))-methyltransferase [Rosenbergiella australiborealis]MBT0726290.1 23S rRNA (guanine(745)-N(1))-methyltransferase [Rosenbergiella australiborealis]